ncbi:uncharacterized protein METZ01_LOCUS430993, partial [marine metagenome]
MLFYLSYVTGGENTNWWHEQADIMVKTQIEKRGIQDERILRVMRETPRHLFVPEYLKNRAYEDGPLPIGEGQTISQPYIVAIMTELLQLHEKDRVLEIGTGSGYQAAVLSQLVNRVYSIEIGRDDNIWFGTEAGLSLFDGEKWANWNHKNGLGASYKLVEKDNRQVTDTFKGAHHNYQTPDLPNTESAKYRPNYIVSMLLDKANRLWIGTWGGGLSLFDPETLAFRNFTVQDGLPGNYILAINEGPDGNLWI